MSNAGQQMITYTTYQTNELTAENTMNIKKKNMKFMLRSMSWELTRIPTMWKNGITIRKL